MMLKIPFYNRKRYIVIKAYTNNPLLNKHAPITTSSLLEAPAFLDNPKHECMAQKVATFRTCYSRVKSLKNSAVLPSWCTIDVNVSDDLEVSIHTSDDDNSLGTTDFIHNTDPYYNSKNNFVVKHNPKWLVEEETGVNFVYAQHINNVTNMKIPSSVITFKDQHYINVFNLVSKFKHTYTIPFRMPILALYPMSSLPLHVESYYDCEKYHELGLLSGSRFWNTNKTLKLEQLSLDK